MLVSCDRHSAGARSGGALGSGLAAVLLCGRSECAIASAINGTLEVVMHDDSPLLKCWIALCESHRRVSNWYSRATLTPVLTQSCVARAVLFYNVLLSCHCHMCWLHICCLGCFT